MGLGLSAPLLGMYFYSIGYTDFIVQVVFGMIFITSSLLFVKYVLKLNDFGQKVKK